MVANTCSLLSSLALIMLVGHPTSLLPVSSADLTLATYNITAVEDIKTDSSITSALNSLTEAPVESVSITTLTDLYVQTDACPAGAYSNSAASTCTECPAGKYLSTSGGSSPDACIACDQGSYSTETMATDASTCLPCPPDTYFSGTGGDELSVCESCPENSGSYEASKSLSSCVCNAGYYGPNGDPCSPCKTGEWCINGQSNLCPQHSTSPAISSTIGQCLCLPGFFGDTTLPLYPTLCQVCPPPLPPIHNTPKDFFLGYRLPGYLVLGYLVT